MKYIIQIALLFIFSISLNAQKKTTPKLDLDKLSEKQKLEVLGYAITLTKDYDRSLKKAIKKLSPEQSKQLMDYVATTEKIKEKSKKKKTKLTSAENGPLTTMEFDVPEYDFGEATEGDKISYSYKFKNTGKEPLVISHAKGSCGCTVPKWPKDPIAPGETGEIDVVFNTKGKRGNQVKVVTLTANTSPGKTIIKIKGQVNPVKK